MLAGVLIAIVSTIFYNAGFVVEKTALDRLPRIRARRTLNLVLTLASSPRWLLGFTLLLVGLGCQVLALSLAPISVVQPIFACGIALLLLLSRFHLGERLSPLEWTGLVSIAISIVMVGASVDRTSDTVGLVGGLPRILSAAAPTVVVAVLVYSSATRLPGRATPLYGLASGLLYGAAGLATKQISTVIGKEGLLHAIPKVLVSPEPYLFVVLAALGMVAFQTGLQRCRASLVAPTSNVISSGYLVAVGTPLFGEHLPTDPWRLTLRVAGFAGILIGMAILTRSKSFDDAASEHVTPEGLGQVTNEVALKMEA